MDRWERADRIIDRVEQTLLAVLLSLMIVIAFAQIVLRNLFATGIIWGDPLVRTLVLWVAFVGAAIATREGKHISIDVASRLLPVRGKAVTEVITQFFSCLVCGLLTYAAVKFVRNEAQMGSVTFLGIPGWVPQIILPLTFALMAFRFCLRSLRTLSQAVMVRHESQRK